MAILIRTVRLFGDPADGNLAPFRHGVRDQGGSGPPAVASETRRRAKCASSAAVVDPRGLECPVARAGPRSPPALAAGTAAPFGCRRSSAPAVGLDERGDACGL